MSEYELFNEETAEFSCPYLSDKIIEKGDVLTFQDENYFVSDLMMKVDHKLRIAGWPAKIYLPRDIEDLRFLHWIQHNLTGLKIRLSNDASNIREWLLIIGQEYGSFKLYGVITGESLFG